MNDPQISANPHTERYGFRWWHAAAVFTAANLVSAMPAGYGGDNIFYNTFARPPLSPPDWLFAPMWLFLNITSLIALAAVANSSNRSSRRQAFLMLEGIGWILFAVFTTLYFWLQSPILGAIDTVAGLIVGLGSLACCAVVNRWAAFLILLRVLWLSLASYVSLYVALHNIDPFFRGLGR